jgi:hypothetical protein
VIALFCGQVLINNFSEEKLRGWVEPEISKLQDQWIIEFDRLDVNLSQGLLPSLSLRAQNVSLLEVSECGKRLSAKAERVSFPLSLSSLLSGKVPFDSALLSGVKIKFLENQPCKSEVPLAPLAAPTVAKSEAKRPPQSVLCFSGHARYPWRKVKVSDLVAEMPDSGVELVIKDFKAQKSDSSLDLKARLSFQYAASELITLPKLQMSASLSKERSEISAKGRWREGRFNANIKGICQRPPYQLSGAFEASHLPATELLVLFRHLSQKDLQRLPRTTWISFKGSSTIRLSEPTKSRLEISESLLAGSFGRVKDIDLRKVFESIDESGPRGVFSDFGKLNGLFTYKAPNEYHFEGEIRGLAAIFANEGLIRFQRFPRIPLKVERVAEEYKIATEDSEVEGGSFKGNLTVNWNERSGEKNWHWDIKEAQLSPGVNRLFFKDERFLFNTSGKALSDREGQLKELKSEIYLPALTSRLLGATHFRAAISYSPSSWDIQFSSPQAKIFGSTHLARTLNALSSSEELSKPILSERLEGLLTLSQDALSWSEVKIIRAPAGSTAVSHGSIYHSGIITGEIETRSAAESIQVWKMMGTLNAFKLLPNNESAKELLNRSNFLRELTAESEGANLSPAAPQPSAESARGFDSLRGHLSQVWERLTK